MAREPQKGQRRGWCAIGGAGPTRRGRRRRPSERSARGRASTCPVAGISPPALTSTRSRPVKHTTCPSPPLPASPYLTVFPSVALRSRFQRSLSPARLRLSPAPSAASPFPRLSRSRRQPWPRPPPPPPPRRRTSSPRQPRPCPSSRPPKASSAAASPRARPSPSVRRHPSLPLARRTVIAFRRKDARPGSDG